MKTGEKFNPYRMLAGPFMPNAILKYKGLSASAKLVWARLAQYAGENGICFPSQKTLAEETGTTKQTVIKAIKQLILQGFLTQEKPAGEDKLMRKTTRYFFLWHECFAASETKQNHASIARESAARESKDLQDTQTKDIISRYCELFKNKYGKNPLINKKDAGISQRLSKIPEVLDLLEVFFNSTDKFIVQNAYSLPIFENKINQLRVKPYGRFQGLAEFGKEMEDSLSGK